MKFRFLISDVDGTLIDRMAAFTKAFCAIITPFGITRDKTIRYYLAHNGMPLQDQIIGILQSIGVYPPPGLLVDLLEKFWHQAGKTPPKLFPGVKETLLTFQKLDLKLCYSSGSQTFSIRDIFQSMNLPYDIIIGSESIPKGDVHIDELAKFFDVERQELCRTALLVGDGCYDMKLARRNGIFAIGVTNTSSSEDLLRAGAQKVINQFPEILEIIKS